MGARFELVVPKEVKRRRILTTLVTVVPISANLAGYFRTKMGPRDQIPPMVFFTDTVTDHLGS